MSVRARFNFEKRCGNSPKLLIVKLVPVIFSALLAACAATAPTRQPTNETTPKSPDGAASIHTIAVLPLDEPGLQPDTNWFTDGISRELIRALGRNARLRVIAWQTAAHWRDSKEPPRTIGESIQVAYLLRGTILRQDQQLVLYVELVDTKTGRNLWSNSFDGSFKDVAVTEQRIARDVATALHTAPAAEYATHDVDPEAHDLVLGAQAILWSAHSPRQVATARGALAKAIAQDPAYARAHAVMAQSWMHVVLNSPSTLQQAEALPKARAEAQKALALDPDNLDALYVLGNADINDNNPQHARIEYSRVVAIDPSDALAHIALGDLATDLGSMRKEFDLAAHLDPFNATAQNNLADAWLDLGRYRQALAAAIAYRQLQPRNVNAAYLLALDETLLHRGQDAIAAFDLAAPRTDFMRQLAGAGALAYRSVLDPRLHAEAVQAVDAMRQWSALDPESIEDLSQAELVLGEKDEVLAQLPGLCRQAPIACADLGSFPLWLPLHGDPRFEQLAKQYTTLTLDPAPTPALPR